MKNIEIRINEEKGCFINCNGIDYHIGDPEGINFKKSLNKGKRDLVLMYKGPEIPQTIKHYLSAFAEDSGLRPEIMSRESVYLPNYRDVWSAEIPPDFEVDIKYTSIK